MSAIATRLEQDDLDDSEDGQRDQYLTFRIGNEEFAITIAAVVEIVGIQHITQIPDMPPWARGMINLRGRVIPCLDVRLRFGMEGRSYDERTCIVVVDLAGSTAGLIVDTVSEVLSIPSASVAPPPQIHRHQSRYVRGLGRVGDAVKILLNLETLLVQAEGAAPSEAPNPP